MARRGQQQLGGGFEHKPPPRLVVGRVRSEEAALHLGQLLGAIRLQRLAALVRRQPGALALHQRRIQSQFASSAARSTTTSSNAAAGSASTSSTRPIRCARAAPTGSQRSVSAAAHAAPTRRGST